MEQQKVEIPRGALTALVVALVASLMLVAFLLGRQSAQPIAAPAPSQTAIPVVAVASPLVSTRETPLPARPLVAPVAPSRRPPRPVAQPAPAPVAVTLPKAAPAPARANVTVPPAVPPAVPTVVPPAAPPSRIKTATPHPPVSASIGAPSAYPQASGSPGRGSSKPPSVPGPSGAEKEAVRRYLSQVDAVISQSGSLGDPSAFATQLLQQSMQGDNSGFDSLLKTSQAALDKMRAIKPPPSCKEHHKLMVGQLGDGLELLRKVKAATTTGDTSGLGMLSIQGKDMQSDLLRLQELDNKLRASVR